MHIGIVLRNFGGGGAQRAQLTLAGALIGKGHRVDLVPMQFNGHYRSIIPDGARLYRRRRRKSDRDILEYCRARGIEVQTLAFDPLAVVAARRRLRQSYPRIGLRWSEVGKAVGVARYVREATPQILISGRSRLGPCMHPCRGIDGSPRAHCRFNPQQYAPWPEARRRQPSTRR